MIVNQKKREMWKSKKFSYMKLHTKDGLRMEFTAC